MADEEKDAQLDIGEQSRLRAQQLQEEQETILTRRMESLADLTSKQECWCGSEVVNPHSNECQNIKNASRLYKEAKKNYTRVDDVESAQAEAISDQEEKKEEEEYLAPGQKMAQEVDDWSSLLNEARSRDWNMSDEKDGTDSENDKAPSEETPNRLLGTKPVGKNL